MIRVIQQDGGQKLSISMTAVNVAIADAGGHFTGTEVETALQEIGADLFGGSPTLEYLEIDDSHEEELEMLLLNNRGDNNNVAAAMMRFQVANTGGKKGAIGFIKRTTSARGDLYFAVNNDADNLHADINDLAMIIKADGKVGIGTDSPDGLLHVFSSSAGTVTPAAWGDDLVIEATGAVGMSLLTADGSNCYIALGDASDSGVGRIHYGHTDNFMAFWANAAERVRIGSGGILFVGETSNNNMTRGITIKQAGYENEVLAFKNADVIHGHTQDAETDTYGFFRKVNEYWGGLQMFSICENNAGAETATVIESWGGQPDTTKTTAARALVEFRIGQHTGSNAEDNIDANGNIFAVRAEILGSMIARMMVDEDGDLYCATSNTTFDKYDDLALCDAFDQVRSEFGEWLGEKEDMLIELGILGGPIAEGGMTNVTRLQKVQNGAIRQIAQRLDRIDDALQLQGANT